MVSSLHKSRDKLVSRKRNSYISGRLAASIAHDVNNVLSAVLSSGEILLDRNSSLNHPSVTLQEVSEILDNCRRAVYMVNEILDFSHQKSEANKIVNVGTVITNLIPLMSIIAGKAVELKIHDVSNLYAHIDQSKLERVLINLVVNARDAIKGSGIVSINSSSIDIASPSLSLKKSYCGKRVNQVKPVSYVEITVEDTGSGIDDRILSSMFRPFVSTKPKFCKGGLGLSTVQRIIKKFGGRISVTTQKGVGTRFSIFLKRAINSHIDSIKSDITIDCVRPQLNMSPVDKQEQNSLSLNNGSLPCKDTCIIILEDEPALLEYNTKLLSKLGFHIYSFSLAKQALEILTASPEKQILVITDLVLPDMSGVELYRRAENLKANTRFLFVSAYSPETMGILLQNCAFLRKPYSARDLVKGVDEILKKFVRTPEALAF
jgi:nitrogen-specific signal transduction histidine kinase/ActR/RegA family two-component response regulator